VAWHRGPVEPISDYIKQRNTHLNTVQGVWVYQFSVAWHRGPVEQISDYIKQRNTHHITDNGIQLINHRRQPKPQVLSHYVLSHYTPSQNLLLVN